MRTSNFNTWIVIDIVFQRVEYIGDGFAGDGARIYALVVVLDGYAEEGAGETEGAGVGFLEDEAVGLGCVVEGGFGAGGAGWVEHRSVGAVGDKAGID